MDVFTYLPLVQAHIEGCGITPFNVWDLSFEWWRRYRDLAIASEEALRKQNRG